MKNDIQSRKQQNLDKMHDLISELAENLSEGDREIYGELFPRLFADLSIKNQEYYIAEFKERIQDSKSK